MAYSLEVRQHEILIVQGSENQNLVFDLFTVGMNPCVGLILWHPNFCALAHIDDPSCIGLLSPAAARFSEHCKATRGSVPKPFALIVMAHGVGGGKGWWSEHMKSDIESLCGNSGVAVEVVRPQMQGDAVNAQVTVSNGARNYSFKYGDKMRFSIDKKPESETWYKRLDGTEFSFGFFQRASVGTASILYVKGSHAEGVAKALAGSE
jgi:hypothetical protein